MTPWLGELTILGAKTCWVLVAGFLLTRVLVRSAASVRHSVWAAVLCGVLVMPLAHAAPMDRARMPAI